MLHTHTEQWHLYRRFGFKPLTLRVGNSNSDAYSKKHFKCGKCSWSGSYLKTLVEQSQSPPSTGLQSLCWMTDSLMPEKRIKNVIFHFYHMKAAQASFCNHKHCHREDCGCIHVFLYRFCSLLYGHLLQCLCKNQCKTTGRVVIIMTNINKYF